MHSAGPWSSQQWVGMVVEETIQHLEMRLARRLRNDLVIPPYPAVAAALQQLSPDTATLAEITKLIASDPVLSALILRLTRSADLASTSVTLPAAVSTLGLNELVRLAISCSLGAASTRPGPLAALRREEWRHALLVAVFCSELAPRRGVDPDEAYLAGLLHDFGVSVAIASLEAEPNLPVLPAAVWRQIVEEVHVEVGAFICLKWKLPRTLVEVIACHHARSPCTPSNRALVELVADVDHACTQLVDTSAFGAVPGLSDQERDHFSQLIPKVVGDLMRDFEVGSDWRSPAIDATRSLRSGLPIDVTVSTTREVRYLTVAINSDQLAIRGPVALVPGWVTEIALTERTPLTSLLVSVISCDQVADEYSIVVQPFGLEGEAKTAWLEMVDNARAGRRAKESA